MEIAQRAICDRYLAGFLPTHGSEKLGLAANLRMGLSPINGLRHPPVGDTSGWYIWAGTEVPDDPDFFKPLHAAHIGEWCPQVEPYLSLAPGWRFLIADDSEDVWFDASLLTPT